MVKCIQYPQEIEVFYLIPALRRELAIALKGKGLEQKEIAKLLNITDAAVSQYFSSKRGVMTLQFNDALKKKIHATALKLLQNSTEVVQDMQELLKISMNEGLTCQLHKQYSVKVEENCDVCFEDKP